MSFFGNINTEVADFEMGGGEMAPIPKNTRVLAICEEAKNSSYKDEDFLNLKWRVSQPAEYAKRVLFQKLKVFDDNKGETHRKMLAAIATNAGGKLFAAMAKAGEQAPSDASLSTITNMPMVLLLDVWELEDKSKSGNWVKAVSPRKANGAAAPAPAPVAPPKPKPAPAVDFDESTIPF